MKLVATLLLLAVSYTPSALSQATSGGQAGSMSAGRSDSKARLQLTTSLVEQKHHCSNFMGLKVLLTFKNVGGEPIILDKRSFLASSMVSRDLEAATARQYESTRRYTFDGSFFIVDPSDMSNFVVLKPGEVYKKEDGVGSFLIDYSVPPRKGYLSPGTHFLQLKVNTWSYLANSVLFRERWKDKGVLWLELMTSEPMPFTVKRDSSLPPC